MARDTSAIAFQKITEEGLLKKLQLKVYRTLYAKGPMTASEVRVALIQNIETSTGTYSTRLSELERKQVVTRVGKRVCNVTGNLVYAWDVTSKLPLDKPTVLTKQQKKELAVKELRLLYKEVNNKEHLKRFKSVVKLIKDI